MMYDIGDVIKTEPTGPHAGPRIGKIKQMTKRVDGTYGPPVLVGFIDYPEEYGGWNHCFGAWVRPIGKPLLKFNHNQ